MPSNNAVSPYSPPIQVTDQTGSQWPGVPGYTNADVRRANQRPLGKRISLVPVIGKKPPIHPDYQRDCYKRQFYQASYDGGSDYKEACDSAGDPIFIAHVNEPPDAANVRKRMSMVRNYCASLVNKFGSYIFSQPIVRSTDPRFVEWSKDVDCLGTPLPDFMEEVSDHARTLGVWGVVFDTTKESDFETVATATAMGNRPVLSHLHPGRIINWSPDRQQMLIQHDAGEFGEVWLWDQTSISKFTLNKRGIVEGIGEVVDHGYPRMPIVLASGLNDYRSLIKVVAEIQKRLFHIDSVTVEELVRQTFTSFFILGISEQEMEKSSPFAISGRKFTCVNRPKSEVEVVPVGSQIGQAQSLREQIVMDEREVFRTMGLRDPSEVASHPESGKALKMRQAETVKMAQTLASNSSNAEREIVDLYNFATGSAIESPIYPNSFDEDDLVQLLTDTIQVINGSFGPKLKATQVVKWLRQAYREAPVELRVQLEQEAQQQTYAVPAAPGAQDGQDRNQADVEDKAVSAATSTPAATSAKTAATAAPAASGNNIAADGDIRIDARIKSIDPQDILRQHGADENFKQDLMDSMRADGYSKDYPILSVETVHGHIILDGVHRASAAKALGIKSIPSYVIPYDEYQQLLAAKFANVRPKQLSALDQYVFVKRPGEKAVPYTQVRSKNDHANGQPATTAASSAATSTAATSV